MKRMVPILILLSFLGGCAATVGRGLLTTVPGDAAQTCEGHCAGIGMQLAAVAIMANNVGCVCEPQGTKGAHASAGITAGMATIMLQAQQQQQQQNTRSASQ